MSEPSLPNPPPATQQVASRRAARGAQDALRLAEAIAQIEELVEANQRLRADLSEMTLKWAKAAWFRGDSLH